MTSQDSQCHWTALRRRDPAVSVGGSGPPTGVAASKRLAGAGLGSAATKSSCMELTRNTIRMMKYPAMAREIPAVHSSAPAASARVLESSIESIGSPNPSNTRIANRDVIKNDEKAAHQPTIPLHAPADGPSVGGRSPGRVELASQSRRMKTRGAAKPRSTISGTATRLSHPPLTM